MFRRRYLFVVLVAAMVAAALAAPHSAEGAGFVNWSSYQNGSGHGSHNPSATAIKKTDAAGIVQAWKWVPGAATMAGQPGPQLNASPTVYDGRVYIGARTGVFYALDEATGAVLWQRFIGYQSGITCTAQGFASTATVAPDPTTGALTVYVAAFTGEVYALNAADGSIRWKKSIVTPSSSANDYALWGSPVVASGHVYIGTSSACDRPLVRAGVMQLSQADGAIQNNYYTQAANHTGGSIWSSVAVDPSDGSVYASTGNPNSKATPDDAYSIVRLDGQTLAKTGIWTVPVADQTFDADFGASPTLFTASLGGVATKMVGACNKNGKLYALKRDNLAAGPVWTRQVSQAGSDPKSCIGGLSYDGTNLYQATNATTIGGTAYNGSIRALNPATGATVWEDGLPNNVINTPTINGSGVLGVGTFDVDAPTTNKAYLIDTANGNILKTITTSLNGGVFGQMVFADNYVFIPSVSNGMRAFRSATAPPANLPPVARFTPSCSTLACSFDGSASSDPDGTVASWAWDFGDTTTGTGSNAQHTYARAGTYQVTLTVTDDKGATGSASTTVTVGQQAAGIAFRGSATANGNLSTANVTIPAGVSAGDGLLLFASINNTTSTVTDPAGWQKVGEQVAGTGMRTVLWQRVATASDAGSTARVTLSATSKVDVQLLAYSGTGASGPVLAFTSSADLTSTSSHTSPTVNVPTASGSWVVTYWSDKSGTTTGWTAPAGQTTRPHSSYTTPAAYITSLITDSAAAVPAGTYGGFTASVNAPSSKATMFTVALNKG